MDRSPPEVVNTDAQEQSKKLKAIVRSAWALGVCFFGFGLLGLGAAVGGFQFDPLAFSIASTLMSSGVMYVVFAMFLRRRRMWAWLATMVIPVVLLIAVAVFAAFVAMDLVSEFTRAIEPDITEILRIIVGPLVWVGSWVAALILIVWYLVQSLPAVREEEAGAQLGFGVIPVAEVARTEHGLDAARERAG